MHAVEDGSEESQPLFKRLVRTERPTSFRFPEGQIWMPSVRQQPTFYSQVAGSHNLLVPGPFLDRFLSQKLMVWLDTVRKFPFKIALPGPAEMAQRLFRRTRVWLLLPSRKLTTICNPSVRTRYSLLASPGIRHTSGTQIKMQTKFP